MAFGIYIHIPYCTHRCSYCDFYSLTDFGEKSFETIVSKLCQEIESASLWLRRNKGFHSKVSSIFIGGGTPSLVPPKLLGQLARSIDRNFPLEDSPEITMEANPETLTEATLEELVKLKWINRVSLGVQSFSSIHLKTLDRLATPESVLKAIKLLKEFGFKNFNLDFIFGIPGQSLEDFEGDLKKAMELGASHISFYQLTLKPAHSLYAKLPVEDEMVEFYERGIEVLEDSGFEVYEVSNSSRPGKSSRHNLLYWSGGDYLGVGPSASSRFFWDGVFHHRKQVSELGLYLKQNSFQEIPFEKTTQKQTVLEAAFLELRKSEGVCEQVFYDRYKYKLSEAKKFPLFKEKGFLIQEKDSIRLSHQGRLLADTVTSELVDY